METRKVDFAVRTTPWSQLGTDISDCRSVQDALGKAGLNWNVRQAAVQSVEPLPVFAQGFKLNIRNTDDMPLGIVKAKYKVIQNHEAFAFTDSLAEEGITFHQAGQLQGGRKVWVLGKLPEKYIIAGDTVSPYLLFINSHDGSTGIKIAMTPVRVVCCNMLNLALRKASRTWSAMHAGDIGQKLQDARNTLLHAYDYMENLGREIENLNRKNLSTRDISAMADHLFPIHESMTGIQKRNVRNQKENLLERYFHAPDLADLPDNAYRFINAVSDFATHSDPLRKRNTYQESLFSKVIDGHQLIDKAYQLLQEAA